MKRKRVGRICDWNPYQSFAALGITVDAETRKCAEEAEDAGARAHGRGLERGLNEPPFGL
jgi:hypothetical protein